MRVSAFSMKSYTTVECGSQLLPQKLSGVLTVYYLDKFSIIRKNLFLINKIISLLELEKRVFTDAPDIVPAIYVLKRVKDENNIVKLYKSQKTRNTYDLEFYSDFYKNSILQSKLDNKNVFLLNTNNSKEALIDKLSDSRNNSPDNFKSPTVECGFQHHH